MTQAEYLAVKRDLLDLKKELEFMPTELEKTNLEAHVDLCAERYKGLHDRLSAIEVRLGKIIATAGTVVAGLLSTVVVILMKMPG